MPAVAVPLAVAKFTDDAALRSPVRVTVNTKLVVPLSPSARVTSLIARAGGGTSSFVIVPSPWASEIVAPVAPDRLTVNVSSGSTVVSPLTRTVIVAVAWLAAKFTVPVWLA